MSIFLYYNHHLEAAIYAGQAVIAHTALLVSARYDHCEADADDADADTMLTAMPWKLRYNYDAVHAAVTAAAMSLRRYDGQEAYRHFLFKAQSDIRHGANVPQQSGCGWCGRACVRARAACLGLETSTYTVQRQLEMAQ